METGQRRTDITISLVDDDPSLSGYRGVPTLTILCHPDGSRIGERAVIEHGTDLSRKRPVFSPSISPSNSPSVSINGRAGKKALEDPVLSRRPVRLQRLPSGAFSVTPAEKGNHLEINGVPVHEPIAVRPEDVARGLILTVGRRVVLLWHMAQPYRVQQPELGLLGNSDGVRAVRQAATQVARLPVPVLIRGESGVGKELVARAIHAQSDRCERPLVCVNMGAVTPSTAISELFGHKRGAFTGAGGDHDGYFAQADGGTLFLDEIAEAAPEIQVMLLRALETGEIRPLGSKRPERVAVRLITATDTDLTAAVAAGRFRLALLHRLASFQIRVPPLRARRDDIGLLFMHFLRGELQNLGRAHLLDLPDEPGVPSWFPPRVMSDLASYHWPGNVRQLRNIARQLAIANAHNERFKVPTEVRAVLSAGLSGDEQVGSSPEMPEPEKSATGSDDGASVTGDSGIRKTGGTLDIPHERLIAALQANDWRAGPAARDLGIARASLYRLMARNPLIRQARDLDRAEIAACAESQAGDLTAMARALQVSRRALRLRITELGMGEVVR